jgi:hypothetical protein
MSVELSQGASEGVTRTRPRHEHASRTWRRRGARCGQRRGSPHLRSAVRGARGATWTRERSDASAPRCGHLRRFRKTAAGGSPVRSDSSIAPSTSEWRVMRPERSAAMPSRGPLRMKCHSSSPCADEAQARSRQPLSVDLQRRRHRRFPVAGARGMGVEANQALLNYFHGRLLPPEPWNTMRCTG